MSYGFGYLNDLVDRAHSNARNHLFWADHYDLVATGYFLRKWPDGSVRPAMETILACLALIASEVGQAVEATRIDDKENFSEELADIVIRVMDLAGACHLNLEQAIVDKMAKNELRPVMHGKLA